MSSSAPIKIHQSITALSDHYINLPTTSCPISSPFHFNENVSHIYCVEHVMVKKGYIPLQFIGSTLQGSIWMVKSTQSRSISVIKIAQKQLHKKSVAVVNGKEISVKEDIMKETAVLRYLSSSKFNPPKSLAKFESFFSDENNYFLVMEFGGCSLFSFVEKCHKLIINGVLTIKEWHRFCKLIFTQIIELMDWMHNKMNCCHLDISLENFVINNVTVDVDTTNHIRFTNDAFVIKTVDFGLSEVFVSKNLNGNIDFQCTKYVGKTSYKAPNVYDKRIFDARAADIWSLGVVLFIMLIGVSPYRKPTKSDSAFRYIINGEVIELLYLWERLEYVTAPIIDLMQGIFVQEKYRLNIKEIKKHPLFL